MNPTLEQIDAFPDFGKLTREQKQALIGLLTYEVITPKNFATKIGDFADDLYFLLSGEVQFYYLGAKQEKIVTHVAEKGDLFGEVGVLHEKRRTAYTEVIKSGAVLKLSDANLDKVLETCPQVGRLLMKRMAFRLANLTGHMEGSLRPLKETYQQKRTRIEKMILKAVQVLGSVPSAVLTLSVIVLWLGSVYLGGNKDFAESPYALFVLILTIASFVFSLLILINQNREAREQNIRDDRMDTLMLEIRNHTEGVNKHLSMKKQETTPSLLNNKVANPFDPTVPEDNTQTARLDQLQ